MWIEKTSNGKFKAVERFIDTYGKTRRISVTLEKNTAKARKEAQSKISLKIDKALSEQGSKNKEISLKEVVTLYLSEKEKTLKASTFCSAKSRCKKILEIFNKNMYLTDLNARIIKVTLLNTGKGKETLDRYFSFLKMLLNWAYKNDFIDDINFLNKIDKFSDRKSEKIEDKFLEADEANKLVNAIENETHKNLARFMILTGVRCGEALALTADDIDLKNRIIVIDKNYQSATHITASPKTKASNREIYIQDELLELCKELKRRALENRLQYNSNLIFQKNGKHIVYHTFYDTVIRTSKKVLNKKITTHFFRHTHVSLLAEQGMQLDAISRRLGHESDEITRAVYFHVTEKLKEKEYKAIEKIKIL